MNELRDENTRLKRLVADLTLDKVMLQDVLPKSSKAGQVTRAGRRYPRALRIESTPHLRDTPIKPEVGAVPSQTQPPSTRRCWRAYATVSHRFGHCCVAKAGWSIRSALLGCTAEKA